MNVYLVQGVEKLAITGLFSPEKMRPGSNFVGILPRGIN